MRSGGCGTLGHDSRESVLPQKGTTFANKNTPRLEWIFSRSTPPYATRERPDFRLECGLCGGLGERESVSQRSVCAFSDGFRLQRCVWSRIRGYSHHIAHASLPVRPDTFSRYFQQTPSILPGPLSSAVHYRDCPSTRQAFSRGGRNLRADLEYARANGALLHLTRWRDTKHTKHHPRQISPSQFASHRSPYKFPISQYICTDSVDGQWLCQRCSQFVNRPQHRPPVTARHLCISSFRPLTSESPLSFTDMIITAHVFCFVG
jgi:hypothetical protein